MKKIFLVLIFITQINAQQSYIDYVSPFHPIVSSKGMVVSQNNLSSDIGRDILNMGGNAVDAAGRYLNQNSAFGGSTAPSPVSVLPPQNQWQGNVPQRFPVGSQTPLPVRP